MKPVSLVLIAALLGGAFFAGRMTAPEGTTATPLDSAASQSGTGDAASSNARASEALTGDSAPGSADPTLAGRADTAAPQLSVPGPRALPNAPTEPPMVTPPPTPKDVETFDLEPVKTGQEALALLQGFANTMWEQGATGHLMIVQAMDVMLKERELMRSMGRRDEEVMKHVYPFVRFLVHNEQQVAATGQTVFKTMAEDPMAFEGIDDDTLEIFTEGLGPLLPALLPEAEIAKLSAYGRKILETPEDQQSEAVRRNRRRIQELLTAWAPPLSPAKAAEAIRALPLDEKSLGALTPLFSNLQPEHVREYDLHEALALLVAGGDRRSMDLVPENLEPAERDVYDEAVAKGLARGRVNMWNMSRYFTKTGRTSWDDVRPFVEEVLRDGRSAPKVLMGLQYLNTKPDRAWVLWALETYELPEQTATQILRSYPEKK